MTQINNLSGQSISVFLVEDEPIVALDIKQQLIFHGYSVCNTCASGEDALNWLAQTKTLPNLILMDIQLRGELTGIDVAEKVRNTHEIPIIFLTAYADDKTLKKVKASNPYGYLIKPFKERELITAIEVSVTRSRLENQLREREHLLNSTLESMADGVVVTNQKGIIRYVNQMAANLIGREVKDLLHGNVEDHFLFQKGTGQSLYLLPHSIPVEKWVNQLDDPAGDSAHVWVIRDISERKRLEDQLRQSQKMDAIGRVAGGVAHDFNNILTVIMGYTTLLNESLSADSPLLGEVDGIKKAAKRASRLTQQLLLFSRGKQEKNKIQDLGKIVREMEKMVRRLISEDISLDLRLADTSLQVSMPGGALDQVIMNLAVNARDAMPQGGHLVLTTEKREVTEVRSAEVLDIQPGDYAVLSVTDTGKGISEKDRTRIFDPFFTTKEVGQGTGLGLSMVFGLVKQAEGYITLDSIPGKGSRFDVYLPLKTDDVQEEKTETKITEGSRKQRGNILLVEDEPALLELNRKILERAGYRVYSCLNAGEALLQYEETGVSIDLLLTDIIMPHQNGVKLAERLKQENPELKILFVSGYMNKDTTKSVLAQNPDCFLQKPFHPFELMEKVKEILS